MRKPKLSIEDLQSFATEYLPDVTVSWKALKHEAEPIYHTSGEAVLDQNQIYLHPRMRLGEGNQLPIDLLEDNTYYIYKPEETVTLEEGEQYFFWLLHEIAHFKITVPPTEKFIRIKARVEREYPNDRAKQLHWAAHYVRDDLLAHWTASEMFESHDVEWWIFSGRRLMTEEKLAQDWAIAEFKRRRNDIQAILNR